MAAAGRTRSRYVYAELLARNLPDQLQQALIRGGVLRVVFAAQRETKFQRERR